MQQKNVIFTEEIQNWRYFYEFLEVAIFLHNEFEYMENI